MDELFSTEIFKGGSYDLPYRFHKPEHFEEGKKYPLVLFLHGAGERGNDARPVLVIGIPTALADEKSPMHDAYIIAPQCPDDVKWVDTPWEDGSYSTDKIPETVYLKAADELVDKIAAEYPVDRKKMFVSGISMGGYGAWDTIARHTEKYAGAFICCGGGDPSKAEKLKNKSIYIYHGSLDNEVPVEGAREMYETIKAVGGDVHYKEFPDTWHDSWGQAYSQYEDINELFTHENG